ncbi:MAG: hypothetical protein KAG66_07215, partial [Methylococcales bacterium]|nr:hypothetical protein [Methylococcales bacterium]
MTQKFSKLLPIISLVTLVLTLIALAVMGFFAYRYLPAFSAEAEPAFAAGNAAEVNVMSDAAIATQEANSNNRPQPAPTARSVAEVDVVADEESADGHAHDADEGDGEAGDGEEVSAEASDPTTTQASEKVSVNPVTKVINPPFTIYKNNLLKGWENRSWDANVNFNGFPAYDGLTAMTINFADKDGAVYLFSPEPISTANHNVLRFWINGGQIGGQQMSVALVDENEHILEAVPIRPPYPNNWRQVDIPLEQLGSPAAIHGIVWQDTFGQAQQVFFVDEVALFDEPLIGIFEDSEVNG